MSFDQAGFVYSMRSGRSSFVNFGFTYNKSRNFNQRMLAERMAMNTPIQGTAADVIKLAMIAAYRKLREAGLKSRILLQVHDELVLEVKESELETVQAILHEAMEHVVSLFVPLSIDVHWGRNWAEAK